MTVHAPRMEVHRPPQIQTRMWAIAFGIVVLAVVVFAAVWLALNLINQGPDTLTIERVYDLRRSVGFGGFI